ncbi:NACHT domain-containing protein [Streptomyces sp. AM8-1-1]|uniref:NACHT domain-containing protein n=1 Tax=Streptomyces sp. AM8-1-1 TaxID=3075825 RepID=UPI0028C3AB53|nr:NACHT domain-containing protein [Streptomyces sp. AM8-1-1]WNO76850.1 NACHT domain-containing protein [Streptomyces sp. AM8-1-1]
MARVYLLLAVIGLIAALVLARRFDLGVAQTAAAVLPTLAPGYLAWAAFHADRAEAAPLEMDKVLEQLVVAVRTQWDNEADVRRVNDPYPLPVAWRATGNDLAEDWPLLCRQARALPGGPRGDSALWPTDAAGLAGQDAEIGRVFSDKVPTQRLVILGEPGAGKSVLLIRLLQDLIARRSKGDPLPVLFSLASWDARQPVKTWMADQLRRAHPGLVSTAPPLVARTDAADAESSDLALCLLNAGSILPLFDGFDELPPSQHSHALDMLNRALPARQPLVLTSRTDCYRTALTRPGTTVRLNGAAAIELLPLTAQVAEDYLRRDAGGQHTRAADRWNNVITQLGTSSPVGQALATPLGLFLCRTIYNPRFETPTASLSAPHPDELCDTVAYPDHDAVNTHLCQAFIPAAYTPRQPHPPRWTAEQAHHAFVFLAEFQEHQRAGSPDLAWWELHHALPSIIRATFFGSTVGIVAGVVAGTGMGITVGGEIGGRFAAGIMFAITFGLPAGLAAAVTTRRGALTPSTRLRWSSRAFGRHLLLGLGVGLGVALVVGLGVAQAVAPVVGGAVGFTIVLAFMLAMGLRGGLTAETPDLTTVVGPNMLITQDRRSFFVLALAFGLAPGLVFGVMFGMGLEPMSGLGVGLAVGLGVAVTLGRLQAVWADYTIVRLCLGMRRELPIDLMPFLKDAHERRGVLRQVGAVYQFRHIDLQRHLAPNNRTAGTGSLT